MPKNKITALHLSKSAPANGGNDTKVNDTRVRRIDASSKCFAQIITDGRLLAGSSLVLHQCRLRQKWEGYTADLVEKKRVLGRVPQVWRKLNKYPNAAAEPLVEVLNQFLKITRSFA